MNYQETLAKMVENSGLTLKDLADKCKEFGVKVDPSYISKLQTGKQSPASDEINIAIAEACGEKPEPLLYTAFMDKAPEIVRDFMKRILDFFRKMSKDIISMEINSELLNEKIDEMNDFDLIKSFLELENLDFKEENNFFLLKDHENKDVRLIANNLLSITMPDDSMIPIIYKDSKLQIDTSNILNPGDIIVIAMSDNSYLVRRVINIESKIVLIAENRNYEPLIFEPDQVKFVGRVKSMTVEL